ncbi:hypothetical protein F2P56_026121 [Juglans regia]|uniref:gibberellin 3beta-dioxygenase n=2 Tax=Juglans regia TaxID=51240 RepID=A0A833X9R1_JUGRE|nr:gibberellin 3-beta-dioxygenase 1-like [Juglans regia]KAF5456670.1 hypothetical protein F2P56_026121 [Juglans regia]
MSTLSEAYKEQPLHLKHIIPLDFASVGSLMPDSHVWPGSGDFSPSEEEYNRSSVPVIDLRDPNASEHIRRACEAWGVFQLINHGISPMLIEEVEHEAERFFSLPAQQKLKALRSPGGATGYGVARITPFFSKHMWHEGFTIMGSPLDHAREVWPHDHQRFCNAMERYQKEMKSLAERIIRLIFRSLSINSEEEISWLGSSCNVSTALQLNSYPSCPDPNQAMGLAPHTDTFLLTILHQSQTINGLQISRDGVGWLPISPLPGALFVNMGDLFHLISNARFSNVLHRVVVNGTRQRFSVAYFYGPPTEFVVSPLCKGLNSGQVPLYRSVAVKDYVSLKAKHMENALSIIRID